MLHLGIVVYSVSLLSGIILMAAVFLQYRLNGDAKIKVFLGFKLSYTAVMALALVTLYLEINLGIGFVRWFAAGILFLTIPLLFGFSSFLRLSRGLPPARWETIMGAVYALQTLGWIVVSLLFPSGYVPVIAVAVVLTFFFVLLVSSLLRYSGGEHRAKKSGRELKIDALILAAALALGLIEVFVVRPFTIDRGFILTLAVAYLVINIRDWAIYVPAGRRPAVAELPGEFRARYRITDAEQRVARALLSGMSNKAMAHEFGVAENTVKNHIYSLYKKTRVQSRVEFVNRVNDARVGQFVPDGDDAPW